MTLPNIDPGRSDRQSLDEILAWLFGIDDALTFQRKSALEDPKYAASRFVGMTLIEVEDYFESLKTELRLLTKLNLVACAEAIIKADFFHRIENRLKDPISKVYRKWHRGLSSRKQIRPDFDESGILELLKKSELLIEGRTIGEFRECLKARHWIGHGRLWNRPPEINRFDVLDVFKRAKDLISTVVINRT